MRKPLTVLILALLLLSLFTPLVQISRATGESWLTGWNYRKQHTIANSTGNIAPPDATGYQIRIVTHFGSGSDSGGDIYCSSHCQTTFGDLRFTASDGNTLLPYWCQNYTVSDSAAFWVLVNSYLNSSSAIIYIYYGNSLVTTTSNGTLTFPNTGDAGTEVGYDSFVNFNKDPSTNTNVQWSYTNTFKNITIYYSGNLDTDTASVRLNATGAGNQAYTPQYLHTQNDQAFGGWVYLESCADGSYAQPFGTYNSALSRYNFIAIHRSGSNYYWAWKYYDGSYKTTDTATTMSTGTWYFVQELTNSTGSMLIVDGTQVSYLANNVLPTWGERLGELNSGDSYTFNLFVDDFFRRSYVYPEPSQSTYGSEAVDPSTSHIFEDFENWNVNAWTVQTYDSATFTNSTLAAKNGNVGGRFVVPSPHLDLGAYIKHDISASSYASTSVWFRLSSSSSIPYSNSYYLNTINIYGVGAGAGKEPYGYIHRVTLAEAIGNASLTYGAVYWAFGDGFNTYLSLTQVSYDTWYNITLEVYKNHVSGYLKCYVNSVVIMEESGDMHNNGYVNDWSGGVEIIAGFGGEASGNLETWYDDCFTTYLPLPTHTFTSSPVGIGAQVTMNQSYGVDPLGHNNTYSLPYTFSLADIATYVMNATPSLSFGGSSYAFDHWLLNGSSTSTDNPLALYLDGNSTFAAYYTSVTYDFKVFDAPLALGNVSFLLNDTTHQCGNMTYYEEILTSGDIANFTVSPTSVTVGSVNYGFQDWQVRNSSGNFVVTGNPAYLPVSDDTNVTIVFADITPYSINVTSNLAVPISFDFTNSSSITTTYNTPTIVLISGAGNIQVTCNNATVFDVVNYTFSYWQVNGSGLYTDLTQTFSISGNTTLEMVFEISTLPIPFQFLYPHDALSMTWYMRSDTWTVLDQLGYKLQPDNTNTATSDSRFESATESVTYGFRVFYIDYLNNTAELTAGVPDALMLKTTNDSGMMLAYWNCPATIGLVSVVEIRVYQKFDDEGWSLRTIFISKSDLLWKFPAATWTFHLYVSRVTGSTNSTMWYGSYTTCNSRVDLQYFRADPWEAAEARLYQLDLFGFMFMPWLYWLPDVFYGLVMMFIVVTTILYHGTVKVILAEFWLFGGAGSILWAMIPPIALHIAVLFLAVAMGWTFMRLVYGKRY